MDFCLDQVFFSCSQCEGASRAFMVFQRGECGWCQWRAIRHRVRSELLHQDRQFSEQNLSVALSAPESVLHVLLSRHSQHGDMVRPTLLLYGLRRMDAGPILRTGDWSGKLRRRMWDIGGRSLHRHRGLSSTLPPSRTGVRWQPTPAAAATDQLHCPDSSRLVRRPNSAVGQGSPSPIVYLGPGLAFLATCASGGTSTRSETAVCPRQQVVPVLVLTSGSGGQEKEQKLDSRCIVSLGCSLRSHGVSEQEIDSPAQTWVSDDHCRSSSVPAPLNDFAHGGYAGVRLGKARNPCPATHERDRAAEESNARQRRINEAEDSPLGPSTRRPPQARPRHQPQEYLRCARCGPDPSAIRGASDCGLMMHMVQKHGGQQLIQESVAQLRHLDRAACVACDTVRSRRCRRCGFCKSDTPLRGLVVGDTFQDRRQPGHQDAAPEGSPTVHHPLQSSQPVPPGDPLDDSRLPKCPIRDIVLTKRDKQLLAELRRASAMALPRCMVSLCHSVGRKPRGSHQ